MTVDDITPSDSSSRALLVRARSILGYALALLLLSVGAGVLWGLIRLAFSMPIHEGGGVDADLIGRLVGTILVSAFVYRRLARRHPDDYLALGTPVAIINGLATGLLGIYLGTPLRLWLFAVCVAFNVGLMFLSGLVFNAFKVALNNRRRGP